MIQFHNITSLDLKSTYASHLQHVPSITQARLWLPDNLSAQVKRIIYLDGDVIISGSIIPLIDTRVPLIAARPSITNIMEGKRWNRGFEWRGDKCFNAGVLIMNLSSLRQKKFGDWARKTLKIKSANDQTLLNLFCQGDFVTLDRKWNLYVNNPNDVILGETDAVITHYCGSIKPWNSNKKKPCLLASRWHKYDIFK
jgi:lipopolysaccharide biosynthesis glycosyltransferase